MRHLEHLLLLPVLALCLAAAVPVAAGDGDQQVFTASTPDAEVWVSTWLVEHRSSESYTPLLVLVRNRAPGTAHLDRESFALIETDGTRHPLATVAEIRGNYQKATFDLSMGRFYGLPVGTRLDMDDLVPSNFFPTAVRGDQITDDDIFLPTTDWMVDLLYFRTPVSKVEGRSATVRVESEDWEEPVRVAIRP
jgi:hypothetical protein